MRIAVDVSAAQGRRAGIGNYVKFLAESLARHAHEHRYLFWSTGRAGLELPPEAAGRADLRVIPCPYALLGRLWHHLGWPPLETLTGPADVVHATSFLSPVVRRAALVCTVHDVSGFVHPEAADRPPPPLDRFRRWIAPAARILCPSEHTRLEIHRVLGIPPERIRAVHHGIPSEWLAPVPSDTVASCLAKHGLEPGGYCLAVGSIQPRKNLERLIPAFLQARGLPEGHRLVLVGPPGWSNAPVHALLRRSDISSRVRLLPYVPPAELRALYAGARAVLFPSLYEGFGFPILEGMAAGVPVLTSSVSSMPEVAGDAALLVDPASIESIADGIGRIATDAALRADLVRKGAVRVQRFSWEAAARSTAEVYREAADG